MSVLTRIMAKVVKTERCWLWDGATSNRGYPQIHVDRRTQLVHRVLWELTNGPIPEGMKLCHKCDQPLCVRPECHFVGTQADNLADMRMKGRHANPPIRIKVSDAGVLDIRISTEPARVLVKRYGVSREQIRKIRNRSSRAEVQQPN